MYLFLVVSADESDSGVGLCGLLLTMISWGLVLVTLPFSLCVCFKVVQEYERAVIFRLGRLLHGGSRGPGKTIFSIFRYQSYFMTALGITFTH